MLDPHVPDLLLFEPSIDLHKHPLYTSGAIILQDKVRFRVYWCLTTSLLPIECHNPDITQQFWLDSELFFKSLYFHQICTLFNLLPHIDPFWKHWGKKRNWSKQVLLPQCFHLCLIIILSFEKSFKFFSKIFLKLSAVDLFYVEKGFKRQQHKVEIITFDKSTCNSWYKYTSLHKV